VVTRTLTVSDNPAAGDPPPAAPIQMSASLERTTYGLAGSSVALHRQGQETPSGPYIEELYYMHGNHLGSMTLLTDEVGEVVEDARYYPFGGYRQEPTANITDIGYTGHRQDNLGWENTGLIYMGARYYDPLLRRFVSADTIVADGENSLAYNRFAYVYNNPVNMVDPTGRIACDHPNLPDEGPCNDDGTWRPGPEDEAGIPVENPAGPPAPDPLPEGGNGVDITMWLYKQILAHIYSDYMDDIQELLFLSRTLLNLWERGQAFGAAMALFANAVDGGQPWDYKVLFNNKLIDWVTLAGFQMRMDVAANISYGFTGKATGILLDPILYLGAGIAQQIGEAREAGSWGTWGDEPVDYQAIVLGIAMYETFGPGMTYEEFVTAIIDYVNMGGLHDYLVNP